MSWNIHVSSYGVIQLPPIFNSRWTLKWAKSTQRKNLRQLLSLTEWIKKYYALKWFTKLGVESKTKSIVLFSLILTFFYLGVVKKQKNWSNIFTIKTNVRKMWWWSLQNCGDSISLDRIISGYLCRIISLPHLKSHVTNAI